MTHDERLARAIEFNKASVANKIASQIATRDMIRSDTLSLEEINILVDIYPKWAADTAYALHDILQFRGTLYIVAQAHTSQEDWTPDVTPALYVARTPVGVIPVWVQPTGAQDAYKIGDKVLFEGKIYESLIDANTWSPTAYSAGWKLVE